MKITTAELIDDKNLIGHIVLNGIGTHLDVLEAVSRDGEAEIRLTVNGAEIDINSFMLHWQSQVEKMIRDEAMKLLDARFDAVREKMFEFSNALSDSLYIPPRSSCGAGDPHE